MSHRLLRLLLWPVGGWALVPLPWHSSELRKSGQCGLLHPDRGLGEVSTCYLRVWASKVQPWGGGVFGGAGKRLISLFSHGLCQWDHGMMGEVLAGEIGSSSDEAA